MAEASWVAVDWGTSNVRAWVMGTDDIPLACFSSDKGMSRLAPDEFKGVLLSLIGDYLPRSGSLSVVCCGMVGASQGWIEAPYAAAPCAASTAHAHVVAPVADRRLRVFILAGVKQASPPDVMRGEETQIAGYLARNPGFAGTICLPGTHTKWVRIKNRGIDTFRTCLSGELFGLLSTQSVLRFFLEGDGWDDAIFAEAARATMTSPQTFLSDLFGIRADPLLNGTLARTNRARLSGMILGLELAGARPEWQGVPVAIIGEGRLSAHYRRLLSICGVEADVVDAETLTLSGLTAAFHDLKGHM